MTQAYQIGPGRTGDTLVHTIWCGGRESHNSDTPLIVGAFSLDTSVYEVANTSVEFRFVIMGANGVSPLTTHAKLYNVTDAEDVTSSVLNIVDSTSTAKYSATLVAGVAAGELKTGSEKVYECRIYLDVPPVTPATDTIELYKAELQVVLTVL